MTAMKSLQASLKKVGKLDKLPIYAEIINLRYQDRDWDFISDFRAAIQIFEEYLKFDKKPQEDSCEAMQKIFNLVLQATRQFARGKDFAEISAAFNRLQQYFKQADLLAQIYENLGYLFDQQQETEKAVSLIKKSISLAEASGRTDILVGRYSNLGYIHEKLDQFSQAQKCYEQQLNFGLENHLDEAVFMAYCGFGRLNIGSGNFPAAVNYLLEALKYYADESASSVMAVYLNLGTAYGRMSQYQESLKYLSKYITDEIRAQSPEMYISFLVNAANCYAAMENFKKAEASWQLALSLAKQHNDTELYTSILLNYGLIELDRENWQQAEIRLQECLDFVDLNFVQKILATQGMGIACYQLGERDKAKKYLQEVISEVADQKRKLGIIKGFSTLIRIYEEEGDYKNAFYYQKKFSEFERELFEVKYKLELEEIKKREEMKRKKSSSSFHYRHNSLVSQELSNRIKTPLIGVSSALRKVVDLALIAARQENEPVLITGESGTGKEIISRLIHFASTRKDNPFVVVNSAAITETLAESLFFGSEKGAFTGADRRKIGYIEAAQNGSLFLDEIGDLPLSLQAKFLRVIEQKVIQRLGSTREHKIDFRLISATNKDINFLAQKNLFRFDLLNRINTLEIHIPPLRKRLDDIPFLIDYFISELCYQAGREKPLLTKEALQVFLEYPYPGNVRELKNIIRRSLLMNTRPVVEAEDIILPDPDNRKISSVVDLEGNLHLAQAEERLIRLALQKCDNVQVKAAKLLGISPFSLSRKLKKMAE
ncbi:MAG: sigma 54-interacting transcriptional regulator [Candidatus Cloacimonetes bacterium]|nr:sigma 54-interacting transcriptional regulator [Candidatus Cloacimonadota bacterium]MCF7814436.1 sigma 54-interacting transcriptional regulator [Candidatus Cloacimonadota bacterium]MCF7868786.1 sigma 54-interacting transcriptional regulator [Candidatus Cloacimonadota bacterium]